MSRLAERACPLTQESTPIDLPLEEFFIQPDRGSMDSDSTALYEPLPGEIRRFVAHAETRVEGYLAERRHRELGGFVTSDALAAGTVLRSIMDQRLAPNETFLEWGSGFGIVAGVAAWLEFDAFGMEIQSELVAEARALAERWELAVEYAVGTFIEEDDLRQSFPAQLGWSAPDGYQELDLDPAEVGVTYAYPWPGEEALYLNRFARVAPTEAIFVLHRGSAGNSLYRKV